MNATEKIMAALTPGSIFNRNGSVFRSLSSLSGFSGLVEEEVLELLHGDLVEVVTCKPSTKGKGILVALTAHIPQPAPAPDVNEPVQIVVGAGLEPAFLALGQDAPPMADDDALEDIPEQEVPLAEAEFPMAVAVEPEEAEAPLGHAVAQEEIA